MSHPLDGIHKKLERADAHIKKLKSDIGSFVGLHPYTIRTEEKTRDGQAMLRVIAKDNGAGPPPVSISLLAGEIAYQLRSALDHLAVQLICVNNRWIRPEECDWGEFPIFADPAKYPSGASKTIQNLSGDARNIVERFQPYQRGNAAQEDPLWLLHELNNTDKHRVIPITVVTMSNLWLMNTQDDVTFTEVSTLRGEPIELEDNALITLVEKGKPYVWSELPCDVAFQQIASSNNQPVIPLLTQLCSHVGDIVGEFAGEFPPT